MKQKQIYDDEMEEEEEIEKEKEKDDDLNMKNFLKNADNQHQRVIQATKVVHEQGKRLVGVNEKLDDYNQEITYGEKLMDIVQKSPFESFIDGIKGLFKKKKKPETISNQDRQILKNAKNKEMKIDNNIDEEEEKKEPKKNNNNINNYEFKKDGDWEIVKDKNQKLKYDIDDEEEAIKEATNKYKAMTNAVKYFNKSVEDSKKVVEITNDHIDKSRENVNKMNKRMIEHVKGKKK